nr:hypothetical protein [Tanacetum cinerariifolium]
QYTRRARIAQSSTLPPVVDEPASPIGDSTPRVTSLAADEGSMQQKHDELTALYTSMQRQQSEMVFKFEAQELEINSLKARIKLLEDKDQGVADQSGDDPLIKGRRLDEGEEAVERVSDDTEEMETVLTSMDAAKKMVESDTPKKKKLQEQIDVHVARELKEEMVRDAQRMNEQIAKDVEIARIHAEEELQMLIDGLDRNNETEEAERFKRKGLRLEQESVKKLKTSEEVKASEEVPEEKVKEMMQLVPIKEELYDSCGVYHVTFKDKEISMLVEKDYPLRKGLAIMMISYKLQVENYSQMENDLIMKIYKIANYPSIPTASEDFPLQEEVPLLVKKVPPAELHSYLKNVSYDCSEILGKMYTLPFDLNNSMDKSWMRTSRTKKRYIDKVEAFIKYAIHNLQKIRNIDPQGNKQQLMMPCPCTTCLNHIAHKMEEVQFHLFKYMIDLSYTKWDKHGEKDEQTTTSQIPINATTKFVYDSNFDMDFGLEIPTYSPATIEMVNATIESFDEDDLAKFQELLLDAEKPFYKGCHDFIKLSAIVKLLNLKGKYGASDKFFTELLGLLKKMLPVGNEMIEKTYQAKKLMRMMGSKYKKIHVCSNNYILYWKDNKELTVCPVCRISRWKVDNKTHKVYENISTKVMWYFPVILRLQRLFKLESISEDLRWHETRKIIYGVLCYLTDSQAWCTIDEKFPEIAKDSRNLRLGISADGVDVNSGTRHHSVWTVLSIIYNLPLWFWVDTYDTSTKENFNLRVVMLWTINDYLALGTLCGCPYSGFKGCVVCGKDTQCVRLSASSKQSYVGHRRYLPYNHLFKRQKNALNGQQEFQPAPNPLTEEQIYNEVQHIENKWGKGKRTNNKTSKNQEDTRGRGGKIQKQKRKTTKGEGSSNQVNKVYWKKFNFCYQKLRYWRHNSVPHCIDFMHVEKNVCESLVETLLNVSGKTKDGMNARLDLAELGIKPELFARQEKDKTTLPPASYTLTNAEKTSFVKPYPTSGYHKAIVQISLVWKEISLNRLEGCIVEETIVEETIEFFSEYHKTMKTIGIPPNKHVTNENEDEKPLSTGKSSEVSRVVFQEAHLYVIQNTDEIVSYIERHKQVLKTKNPGKRIALLENEHSKSFAKWLRKEVIYTCNEIQVKRELAISKDSVSEIIRWISYGPCATIVKYEAYNNNGYTFRTKSNDGIVYQNIGEPAFMADGTGYKVKKFDFSYMVRFGKKGEVKGGRDDFRVSKSLLGEILRVVIRESGGETFRDDGGAVW